MNETTYFDAGILSSIREWYANLTFLEKVGLWSLIMAGATFAVLALMQPHVQAAIGGALVALGTKILIPVLIVASAQTAPVA